MAQTLIPGFRFKEGRLLIFTEAEAYVLHPWPELKALRKKADARTWTKFVPAFRLLRPKTIIKPTPVARNTPDPDLGPSGLASQALDPEFEKRRAFDNFRYAIPDEAAAAVERFPSRQWRVLELLHAKDQALDLLRQNPALGFCLANVNQFRLPVDDPVDLAARLCRAKQWKLARWLGFPPTDAGAKILGKIQPEAVDVPMLKQLRSALKDAEVQKLLTHLPRLSVGVLALVGDPRSRAMVTPKLLMEVAQLPEEDRCAALAPLLIDLHLMREEMAMHDPPRAFQSVAKLREMHREMSVKYCQRKEMERLAKEFPPPPVPGTKEIVPLLNVDALTEEGRHQNNCVRTYAHWVKSGAGYVYRVLHPERATLSIVMGADGGWKIQQLKLAMNGRVSEATEGFVNAWLKQYSLSI